MISKNIDDIKVPADSNILVDSNLNKYTPKYMTEEILHDGSDSTYLAFPSILKLSEEKVIIAYRAGKEHYADDANMDIIVFNPKTETVISKNVIDGTVGENAQNPELLQMPNGDVMIYLDVQVVGSKNRMGVKQFRSTDGGENWTVETDPITGTYAVLTDDKGTQYGYTFDDVTVDGVVYMLAMTFPELNNNDAGKSVHIIKSSDNGKTWSHVKNLNIEFNFNFNESSIEVCGDGFIIIARGDSKAIPRAFYTDKDFNTVKIQDYTEYSKIINAIGRPKLFIEDGKHYLLARNYYYSGTSLAVYEIDPETMAPLSYVELKDLPGYTGRNSFYAEYYLQDKNGQTMFNVITYADTKNKDMPDIFRYEYIWEEIVTKNAVEKVSLNEKHE